MSRLIYYRVYISLELKLESIGIFTTTFWKSAPPAGSAKINPRDSREPFGQSDLKNNVNNNKYGALTHVFFFFIQKCNVMECEQWKALKLMVVKCSSDSSITKIFVFTDFRSAMDILAKQNDAHKRLTELKEVLYSLED